MVPFRAELRSTELAVLFTFIAATTLPPNPVGSTFLPAIVDPMSTKGPGSVFCGRASRQPAERSIKMS